VFGLGLQLVELLLQKRRGVSNRIKRRKASKTYQEGNKFLSPFFEVRNVSHMIRTEPVMLLESFDLRSDGTSESGRHLEGSNDDGGGLTMVTTVEMKEEASNIRPSAKQYTPTVM
jgi:hypothetical protein